MGKHSNIILIDDNNVILDSAKRVTHEMSSLRQVLPGMDYNAPPAQSKEDPALLAGGPESFLACIRRGREAVQKVLYMSIMGIGPITASEICFRAGLDPSARQELLTDDDIARLREAMRGIVEDAVKGVFKGELTVDGEKPVEFAPYELTFFAGSRRRKADSMSQLMDDYYAEKDKALRISQKSQDLRRLVSLNIERCVKKHDVHMKTQKEIENRDLHRRYGELLTANLYRLSPGMKTADLEDYENPGTEVSIPLDPLLTPIENAQRYFKKYNKEKRAALALKAQMEQNAEELKYLESVMSSLEGASGADELSEIRRELEEQGFARRRAVKNSRKIAPSTPLSFTSSDGFNVLVGKNNRQNDELTQKAAPDDIWLHAKDIPGSHVIIKADGRPVPNKTLEEAASLAAFHSRAKASTLVPVDYTQRRYVKKPAGAKPGMVIYVNQKTAFVKPLENISDRI